MSIYPDVCVADPCAKHGRCHCSCPCGCEPQDDNCDRCQEQAEAEEALL